MVGFPSWCDQFLEDVGPHALCVLSARPLDTPQGWGAVAAVVHGSAKPEAAYEEFVRPQQTQAGTQAPAQAPGT